VCSREQKENKKKKKEKRETPTTQLNKPQLTQRLRATVDFFAVSLLAVTHERKKKTRKQKEERETPRTYKTTPSDHQSISLPYPSWP
jgi:hypothetical protein